MKDVHIDITDNRPAYYFRKGVYEQENKKHLRPKLRKITNKDLMYAITFIKRMN